MARTTEALELASRGFYVFPVVANGKTPAVDHWPERATRDTNQIEKWFSGDYNIGITTSRFGESQALVVVDVDNKNGKNGDAAIFDLEMQGFELPVTLEQSTPGNGRHLIYVTDKALKQGVDVLGSGIDLRSRGGYIVGPGSAIDGKQYHQINGHGKLAPAPEWLVNRLGRARDVAPAAHIQLPGVDVDRAHSRAVDWLKTAPVSIEGEGGDITAFTVACKLKDMGCSDVKCWGLMTDHWNDRCQPPWSADDLWAKVEHAYRYGKEPVGSTAPEAVFDKVPPPAEDDADEPHPVDKLNEMYAFIQTGAFVLQETTDRRGNFVTKHLAPNDMHAWFTNKTMEVAEKQVPLSRLWMARRSRREYEAVVFAPQQDVDRRFYNLWRGFAVEPKAGSHPSVEAFKDHVLANVCSGDAALAHWLLGFFAHMIQRPWEKPLVALVFKGKKGTGKNAVVERVGHLLGRHFLVADDERYLMSNFNAHLESNLFFVLDEASWAGDKRAEGKLKGLITGSQHNIERKGHEPYQVDNLCRVAIIGNEAWLVPASQDERRFAVFNVGDGRKQDRAFFSNMREGMEQGGYCYLLRYLLDFDLSGVDVNQAPNTQGLLDQKHASLESVEEWWFNCLTSDQVYGSTFTGGIPPQIPHDRLHEAYVAWSRQRNIRGRFAAPKSFVATLNDMAPSFVTRRPRNDQGQQEAVKFSPGIDVLRADWERFIGGAVDWSN